MWWTKKKQGDHHQRHIMIQFLKVIRAENRCFFFFFWFILRHSEWINENFHNEEKIKKVKEPNDHWSGFFSSLSLSFSSFNSVQFINNNWTTPFRFRYTFDWGGVDSGDDDGGQPKRIMDLRKKNTRGQFFNTCQMLLLLLL